MFKYFTVLYLLMRKEDALNEVITIVTDLTRKHPEAALQKLLEEWASEGVIETYFEGGRLDMLMEVLAGFIHERCDNLLANIREEDLRNKVLDVARASYELYFSAYTRTCLGRSLEVPVFITDSSELDRYSNVLKELLDSGRFELMILPRSWGDLFFKKYYMPRKTDYRKFNRTIGNIRRIISLLQKIGIINEKFGKLLSKLRNAVDKLHGSLSLDIFRSHKP